MTSLPSAHAEAPARWQVAGVLEAPSLLLWLPPQGEIRCRNNSYLPLWREPTSTPCVLTLDAAYATEAEVPAPVAAYSVPPLLHYQGSDRSAAALALSLVPGGPCTAACIKIAGSF